MFSRILIATVACFMSASFADAAEPVLRYMKSDGKKVSLYCNGQRNGDIEEYSKKEDKLIESLTLLEGSLVQKAAFSRAGNDVLIEVEGKTNPFTMTMSEHVDYSIEKGSSYTIQSQRIRTYRFTFTEKQRGVPISLGDVRRFVFVAANKEADELYETEQVSDTEYVVKLILVQ